ncbi:hypothetical protein V6N11_079263 [Hibiscus sabdariffa]|uniref:NB-ARC domain-containing protein n=1 Tax=Hibiscus sabdariffa TaxID=183260 RepID=A0ABR2RV83_9ROSI
MSDYMPEEVILKILNGLPVKSLMRFRYEENGRKNYSLNCDNDGFDEFNQLRLSPFDFVSNSELGFGFDSRTNDYKLLMVGVEEEDGSLMKPYLFSLNQNCWKRVTATIPPNYTFDIDEVSLLFANVALHWLVFHERNNNEYNNVILGFDLSAEEFFEIKLPQSSIGLNPLNLLVKKYGESSITLLKRDYVNHLEELWWPKVLGFRKNGEVLLQVDDREMASLDLNFLQMELHGVEGVEVATGKISLQGSYVESLVLLDKAVNVHSENDVNHPVYSIDSSRIYRTVQLGELVIWETAASKRKLEELNGLKEDIESIMSTELQPRKKLKAEVQLWLKYVEKINGEVQDLDGKIGESNALTRGFHAEDVSRRVREVEELIYQRRKFHGGLVVDNPQWIGQVLSSTSLSGEAVKSCVEEIWQFLMDDEVRKIGVWGMGGVGKTSIMKAINNQLLKETGKFDIVIWITVSKEMNITKLQEDIASKIGVAFSDDEDETTRAGMLFETLLRKSKFVIILDDLWEKVSLKRIRIPEPSVGSKLVLTTRSSDVVKPLMEEEAWKLFLEKVGRDILNILGVEPIARSIAKRFVGLPLGVITIASCMKGIDDICEWRNSLKELSLCQKSVNGFEDEMFQQLQFSYDRLKDPELQHCFLGCVLYPEDEEIGEGSLIQLWIAKGLVEEMDSMQAEFDRGRAVMNRLINNCLLEAFTNLENERTVKMHDLVKDMALHIAKPRFLVKAGMMLEKPPDVQEWSMGLEKVSLMSNWWLRILYPLEVLPPKCPRLTTLLLSNCDIASILEGFFKDMGALKILDLSANPIDSLSFSLTKCSKLTALLLFDCRINSIPEGFFKHMDALKVLDLSRNPIKNLPNFLSKCSMLTTLLLSHCGIVTIPEGFFKHMDALTVLDLSRNPIKYLPNSLSNCSMLTTLLMSSCCILSIPEDFFKQMGGLKILNLSENRLKSLPHSLSNLKNLNSLMLADCGFIENVPSLSNLQVLKKLDLRGTNIKEFP